MSSLLTLTRAARLVGSSRAALQKKIKNGELETFEGMVRAEDLLRVFPDVRLEDNAVFERLARIKDEAYSRRVREHLLPDASVLAARLSALTREHARVTDERERYRRLLNELPDRLLEFSRGDGLAAAGELRRWLQQELARAMPPAPPLSVHDSLLRLVTAQVRVRPSGHEFLLDGTDSLLDAALRAGIAVDYGCRNASCGRCRARVLAGEVKQIRPSASGNEVTVTAANECLLCCCTAVTDVELQVNEARAPADIPLQHLTGWVHAMRRPRADLMVLGLETTRAERLRFLAGQSLTLLHNETIVGEYAIASCPCESGALQFHIRARPGDEFAQYLFNGVNYGDTVTLHGPRGDFLSPTEHSGPLVGIVWENGFAPIKSMVEHVLAAETAESIHLYWLAANDEGIYQRNLCRAWADALDDVTFTPLVTPAERVQAVLAPLLAATPSVIEAKTYVAGPEAFLDQAVAALRVAGAPSARVRRLLVP